MKHFFKSLLIIAICAMPALAMAQPGSCNVNYSGAKPTIKDFARAYCTQFEKGSPERQALAAITKGNSKRCVVDIKNGYVKYTSKTGGETFTFEMCYWNCDNKNEKLIGINRVLGGSAFDESQLEFYRYDVKNKIMNLIQAPFDREPEPIDMIDRARASKHVIDNVSTAENEDANKFQPIFSLPRTGKNITFRMADPNAVPKAMQRTGTLIWNGDSFNIK